MNLESKDILGKLKNEGLDWAHNHMSTLTYGQAETVKEWYRSGQLGAGKAAGAEEGAESAHADEHAKAKTVRKGGKKKSEDGGHDGGVAVAEAPAHEAPPEHADEEHATTVAAPADEAP